MVLEYAGRHLTDYGVIGLDTLMWLAAVLAMCVLVLAGSAVLAILFIKLSGFIRRAISDNDAQKKTSQASQAGKSKESVKD